MTTTFSLFINHLSFASLRCPNLNACLPPTVLQIECDLCGHRCVTQEGLDLHRLSHTGQTPLKCPVRPCRRRFTSNKALEDHVLAHFQGKLNKSTMARPRYRCQICLKEFAYNSTFNVHMRTHTNERPFEVRGVTVRALCVIFYLSYTWLAPLTPVCPKEILHCLTHSPPSSTAAPFHCRDRLWVRTVVICAACVLRVFPSSPCTCD